MSAVIEVRGRRPGESHARRRRPRGPPINCTHGESQSKAGGYRWPNPRPAIRLRIRWLGWSGSYSLRFSSASLARRSSVCSTLAGREGEGGADGLPRPIRASSASISSSVAISTSGFSCMSCARAAAVSAAGAGAAHAPAGARSRGTGACAVSGGHAANRAPPAAGGGAAAGAAASGTAAAGHAAGAHAAFAARCAAARSALRFCLALGARPGSAPR